VKYTKAGSGSTRTITAKVEVKNLKYTAPFPCNKTGTFQNGELLFDWVIKGYTYYGSRQVEGMTEYLAGPQKGVWYE
jgi:hypothetical protein